jgi:UDP-N-acetylmuramate dehydrogenase
MNIEKDFNLEKLNTFRIKTISKYFAKVSNEEDLKELSDFILSNNLENNFFILGGGSNVLFASEFFDGIVIKNEFESGMLWDDLVGEMVNKGYVGFENLSHIPGAVGGAVVQNIGAYGSEVRNLVEEAQCINILTLEKRILKNEDLKWDYRFSIFKTAEYKNFLITNVKFKLNKFENINQLNLNYKDLANKIKDLNLNEQDLNPKKVRELIIEIRNSKLPNWRDLSSMGSAGSFFKNPVISEEEYLRLKNQFPELVAYDLYNGNYKVSAAYLIDKICNLKNAQNINGTVGTFQNQALVIVNRSEATGEEVKEFSWFIQSKVKEKTNLLIEPEVIFVS